MNIVCIGDSLTYGYDVPVSARWTVLLEQKTGIRVCNKGICGDTTEGMLQRMQRIDMMAYDAVCLMGGSNDILQHVSLEQMEHHMQQMMQYAAQASNTLYVGIPLAMKPESVLFGWQRQEEVEGNNRKLETYRQWLLTQCITYHAVPIDFYKRIQDAEIQFHTSLYADGVHPNEAGYALMADEAVRCIRA